MLAGFRRRYVGAIFSLMLSTSAKTATFFLIRYLVDDVVNRPDFTRLLANCALSISQAGYNTLLETVQAGARAVAVPFAGGAETKQALRARCFAERGLLEVLEESALSPQALAAAADRAAIRPLPARDRIDLAGARNSATLLARWAGERRA